MAGKIAYAQLLNDASEVKILESTTSESHVQPGMSAGSITLELPVTKPPVVVPVIELFLKK